MIIGPHRDATVRYAGANRLAIYTAETLPTIIVLVDTLFFFFVRIALS